MMRRCLCLAVVCMLILAVVSVSNVSAIGLNKIQYTEWLVSTTWTWYTSEGYYSGAAAGGNAFMYIGAPGDTAWIEWGSTVNSWDGYSAWQGALSLYGYTYNATTSVLKSTSGYAEWPVGEAFYTYEGDLSGKITFSSATAFTGNVTIVNPEDGSRLVISLKGNKLGTVVLR